MDNIESIITGISIWLRDELRISKLDDIDDWIWYRVQLYKNWVLIRWFQDSSLLKALQDMQDFIV